MATTVKELIDLLSKYNQDSIITNEQNLSFIHLRSSNNQVILSTVQPIGYCNRTGEKVYPSIVEGYKAFCPELDEDLYSHEYSPLEKYKIVFEDEVLYEEELSNVKEIVEDTTDNYQIFEFCLITESYIPYKL